MSRALPVASSPATSIITTSARSASAIRCAVVAPTLPAPTTVTLYRIKLSFGSEVLENRAGELGGLEQRRILHLPLEVVGDPPLLDGAAKGVLDRGRGVAPAQPAQQHGARKHQRAGI